MITYFFIAPKKQLKQHAMLTIYIKLAFRNLAKHKFFSLLNILGLALGMSACLTVILLIRDQLSFDHFHPHPELVYRVVCKQDDSDTRLATVPYPLGTQLIEKSNLAQSGVRVIRSLYQVDATTNHDLTLPLSGFYTESSFFKVFGFQLESGNPALVLSEPNTLVLSKKAAVRFFGNADPVGEMLNLKGKGTYRITGVVATPPGKTHLDFECLASLSSMQALEAAYKPEEEAEKIIENWENRYMAYVYVRLQPGKTQPDLEKAIAQIEAMRKKVGKADKDVRFFAQRLDAISPRVGNYANELGSSAPWFFIWGMVIFVVTLTLFPCLNYANMAISRALSRIREIGVRKAIGSRQAELRHLILVEAMVTALFALVLAVGIHLPLNQFVITYFPPEMHLEGLHARGLDWLIFIVFALVVGLIAGWIPANRLSKLHPVAALQGSSSMVLQRKSRLSLRSMLLIGQFSVSLILMVLVATLWGQMKYMTLADYGFQKENLLTVELQGNTASVVAAEMQQDPNVIGITTSTVLLACNNLQGMQLFRKGGNQQDGIHSALVDENYLSVMGLKLIAGQNFEKRTQNSKAEYLILNEKALERFQFDSPSAAVGQVLWLNDTLSATVSGVVQDFHYRSFENGIEPFALHYTPESHLMNIRLAPGDPRTALAALGRIWKKIDKVHDFKAKFMEDSIQEAYGAVSFIGGLIGFFSLLSLSLACMGLLGAVTYTVNTKVKEIGIRKVLGATVAQVTLRLSFRYLMLLAVAIAIALPVGYLLSTLLLNQFAYRISVNGFILMGSTGILLLLSLFTIGLQTSRAALANPVKSLRSE
jgi:putative ABC transport system permease protein